MQLYLVRHAHAVDADEDEARPLSAQGREQVGRLATFLRASRAVAADEIWHSPFVRARQTARLLAKGLGSSAPLSEKAGLDPDGDPRPLVARLQTTGGSVAIVGHEPYLSALASLLVVGAARPAFVLRPSAALALERMGEGETALWLVRWHVSPELLGI